ncbi:calcium-binding protein [Chelativorans sp. M5D2P16]|uniref:calcium-binding protein n=1 Tax=Chelativorans sp. M5D2P16 TaxID=3095678 RepID=UPI002ACA5827|nr:calcium-binding protein [Chelativorans sp. M5D2P16]MDZ5696879.1 calcium-binding protein [Chelativorans sp. M5D2P16]
MFSTTTSDSDHMIASEAAKGSVLFLGGEGRETITSACDKAYIFSGPGNDEIFVDGSRNTLRTGDGDDLVHILSGDDADIRGGSGIDTVDFSEAVNEKGLLFGSVKAGDNGLSFFVSDNFFMDIERLVGTRQADTFRFSGADMTDAWTTYCLDGGGGDDRIAFIEQDGPISVDLAKGKASVGELLGSGTLEIDLIGINQITAGNGNDVLTGNERDNLLEGNAGADTLDGGAGDDILAGGYGADRFILSEGEDVIQDFDPHAGDRLVGSGSFTDTTFEEHHAVEVAGTIIDDPYKDAAYYNDLAAQGLIWA